MKKIYLISIMALAALTACQKEQPVGFESGSGVTLDLQIGEQQTRVAWDEDQVLGKGSGSFEATDKLGLYIANTNENTNTATPYLLVNGEISPVVAGETRTVTYYFEDLKATKMRFSAHFPKMSENPTDPTAVGIAVPIVTAAATGTEGDEGYVSAEENQRIAYEANDILVATNTVEYAAASGVQTLPMVFKHAMTKLVVTLDDLTDIETGNSLAAKFLQAEVKVTAKYIGTANMVVPYTESEGVYTMQCVQAIRDAGVVEPIAVRKPDADKAKVCFVFLLPPQTFAAEAALISIVMPNPNYVDATTTPNVAETVTYKYAVPTGGLTFAANTQYTYDFTVGLHRIVLDKFTIAAWDTGATIEVKNPDPVLD